MEVEITRPCRVAGKGYAVGAILKCEEEIGFQLCSIGKAKIVDKKQAEKKVK